MYKFEKKSSTFNWYFVNCLEMYTIVEKTFAIKLIQGRPCMKQRDTGITVKDNREAEVPVHLNSTSIRYISYLIFTCLLILSNAWKLKSIKSIELLTFIKEGKEISCFCSKWIVRQLWELSGRGQQIPVMFLRDIMAELLPFETAKLLTLKHWILCLEHVNIHMWDKMEMTIAIRESPTISVL